MQNKYLEKEILDSIKKFNIIAYGKNEDIVDAIVEVVRINISNEIEDLSYSINSSNDWSSGYISGYEKANKIVNNLLKI